MNFPSWAGVRVKANRSPGWNPGKRSFSKADVRQLCCAFVFWQIYFQHFWEVINEPLEYTFFWWGANTQGLTWAGLLPGPNTRRRSWREPIFWYFVAWLSISHTNSTLIKMYSELLEFENYSPTRLSPWVNTASLVKGYIYSIALLNKQFAVI